MRFDVPKNPRMRAYLLLLTVLVVFGGIAVGQKVGLLLFRTPERDVSGSGSGIAISKLPGPTRLHAPADFELTELDSQTMTGMDDPLNERWADIAGNYYDADFIDGFSYSAPAENGPQVRVRIEPRGITLSGRLEARGLKPNFAYQIKIRGNYARNRDAFEAIGYAGRWRLPGRGTNYTDAQYEQYPDKAAVEAYLLFDFFVTDRNGDAVRLFALDSSLHVLWSATRQRSDIPSYDVWPIIVDARNAEHYARPKNDLSVEMLWAERERHRYASNDQLTRLPAGHYQADLVLTEESFHSKDNDGGYWATVYTCPVEFEILPPALLVAE